MADRLVVGVAGLGLIGGSFALDMQEKGHAVLGCDIDKDVCDTALELGMAHAASPDIAVLEDAAALMIAVPVRETGNILKQVAGIDMPRLKAIFDAGSTKAKVIEWADENLGDKKDLFVPCHPIAGREHSGVRAATAGLFKDRRVVVCEHDCSKEALSVARGLWQECGATIDTMEPGFHDRIFAAVSHLPHLLAYTLVGDLGNKPDKDLLLAHAASGFADFTRIASSEPSMWRDVCLTNTDNIVNEMDAYITALQKLRDTVRQNDGDSLRSFFDDARKLRDGWLHKGEKG